MKNSLAVLVRVMQQAVRDGIIQRNPSQVTGWQREYQRAADELDDPRSLALPDWESLTTLAGALGKSPAYEPRTSTGNPGCGRYAGRPHPVLVA
nr:hypothetical protein [Micromonospora sp. CB01531]